MDDDYKYENIGVLHFLRNNLNYELSILIESLNENKSVLNNKVKDLDKKINTVSINDDKFMEHLISKVQLSSHVTPLIINSFFIMSYSLFEVCLREICVTINKNNPKKITLNDLKGNGDVDKFRKYLYKVHSIDKANVSTNEWIRINSFKQIRNNIVHNHSNIKKNTNQNINNLNEYYLLKEHDTKFNNDFTEFYIYNESFLEDFKKTTDEFINMIYFDILLSLK